MKVLATIKMKESPATFNLVQAGVGLSFTVDYVTEVADFSASGGVSKCHSNLLLLSRFAFSVTVLFKYQY